ncbi:uncharacterized protein LOC116110635 isoform X2 [Pistacia vera]|uniref:uncharacterized protein LOC116110635 isoform X2 n=1 Tax=Pistacia vera TaxID=55513 RepID=UPI001263A031|nr:uncharacterized protein LOC116110635 isoform X2 [Pistacia vera]
MEKMQLRQSYQNMWHSDLLGSIKKDTPYCCFAVFWYVCCAGYMPCSGKCYESSCSELCLGTEGFMLCLQQVACIFSMVACIVGSDELREASQILNLLADLVYCTVCACR